MSTPTIDPLATVTIHDQGHASRLAMHLGRLVGLRFSCGVDVKPTRDARELLRQIDEVRSNTTVAFTPQGEALIRYGDGLKAELDALDAKEGA